MAVARRSRTGHTLATNPGGRIIKSVRKWLAIASAALLVLSIAGFIASWVLNDGVWDKYAAYGEIPIPGSRTVHLPAGDVKASFHTEIAGTMEGGGLPVPQDLEVTISGPNGAAAPKFVQSLGGTTADNQDVHVTVGVVHVPTAGDYTVATSGKTSAYLSPRLSLGHDSRYRFVTWVFAALGGTSVLTLLALVPAAMARARPEVPPQRKTTLQQLDDLAALHNSGALSDGEYEAVKRKLLDGL